MSGDHASGRYDACASGLPAGLSSRLLTLVLPHSSEVVLKVLALPHRVADGKSVFASKAFECMCGYTQAELRRQNPSMLQRPDTDRAKGHRVITKIEVRGVVPALSQRRCSMLGYASEVVG